MEEIIFNNNTFAIIIRNSFKDHGIKFFTPNDYSQQLAYMNRPRGYKIDAHYHNKVERKVNYTQEVLFIKSGKVKVNFYDKKNCFLGYIILDKGDVILLSMGGHGFEMLENSEIIEVKQGPYSGDKDKTRFKPTN